MADTFVLDTSVVSLLLKVSSVHAARRAKLEQKLAGNIGVIGFVTVAELLLWAETANWGAKKRTELDALMSAYAILDPTRATAEVWATTKHAMKQQGKAVGHSDLWIACAALEYSVPLITADANFHSIPNLRVIAV